MARAKAKVEENDTFKAVAKEWIAKNEREHMAEITLSKIRWLLDKAYPKIGNRPIAKISTQEVLAVLRSVEATGRYESARRCAVSSAVSSATPSLPRAPSAIQPATCAARSPCPRPSTTQQSQTPSAGELMRAIEGYTGHAITLYALRLSAHMFVRPGELRQAEWAEFDFDRSVWNLPPEKMKMRGAHAYPLSTQVTVMFEELWELTGTGRYCFPSFRTDRRPMSENSRSASSMCAAGAKSRG